MLLELLVNLKMIKMELAMSKMIDPPRGWRYGFPKEIPDNVPNVMSWLVENGYPQSEIDACGDHFYCSYWIDDAAIKVEE